MILKNFTNRLFTSLILIILVFLIIKYNSFLLFALLIFGIFAVIEFFNIINKITKKPYIKFIQNLIFINYVFLFSCLFFFFSNIIQLKIILFILLFGCIASDIGGYVVGKIFKGPKLSPLSPNKTKSGAIGSLIISMLIMNFLFYYFVNKLETNLIIVSLLTSISCQLGDLFFSFLKRKAKIKDTGNILPGHGGVLDRLDGIFLGVPVGFFALFIIH